MKKFIAIGLAGLLGCASPEIRGPIVMDCASVMALDGGFPPWVAVPAWMEQESQQERSEVDGSRPTVYVVASLSTWSVQEPDMPVFPQDRYAILGDSEIDRILEKLQSSISTTKLTSPRVVAGLGQSSSVSLFASDERRGLQTGGVVFFMSPTAIDGEGVNLRFSFQAARYHLEDQSNSAHLRFGTARLDGQAKLGVGQWYVRAVKGDYPLAAGTTMALFIQIVRVDYPMEPVGRRVALLTTADPSAE